MEPRVFRPSRRRTLFRFLIGTAIGVFGVVALASGGWFFGIPFLAIALVFWGMTACILLVPRAYELHVDERGFRVHDLRGRPVHDVAWGELATLVPVATNSSILVVAFVCTPRRPKQGRIRWRRGTDHDDGCMPDHYGRKPSEIIEVMNAYWNADLGRRDVGTTSGLGAF